LVLPFKLAHANCRLCQVAINPNGDPANPAAMLDISSNGKGLLVPRMDSTARKAMQNVGGMIVYDSTFNAFFLMMGYPRKLFLLNII
jgi:hypothetical protein